MINKIIFKDKLPFRLAALLLATGILIVYSPSLSGEFMLDDISLVRDNPYIREFHSVSSLLSQEDGVAEGDRGRFHTGYYRPIVNVSYILDYKLWGLGAPGFRATNLVLHIATTLLLFLVIRFMVKNRPAAFSAALIFALHPVNTEAVSIVTSRNNLLVALFTLVCVYLYLKAFERRSIPLGMLSVLSFAPALLSKEFAVLILPLLFLYHRTAGRTDRKWELLHYGMFAVVLLGYLYLRHMVAGAVTTPLESTGPWKRIVCVPYLLAWDLRLILLPFDLHYFIVRYPSSVMDPKVLVPLLMLPLIPWYLWRLGNRIVTFAFAAFVVTLFPVMNILPFPTTTLIALRWTYVPFLFLSIGIGALLLKALSSKRNVLAASVLAGVMLFMGAYTYVLNSHLWRSERAFAEVEVTKFGNMFFSDSYAEMLSSKRDFVHAEKYFQIALARNPDRVKTYINYSAALIEMRRLDNAVSLLERADKLAMKRRERAEWTNNFGVANLYCGHRARAVEYFTQAVQYDPQDAQFWTNLGTAQYIAGDFNQAKSSFETALSLTKHARTHY